ncbi:hypothetical protein FSP39_005172 [Pinctada imbricata]|uniref:Mab-21-like HhH/H2TH-like domain-containing protein n=1 Tax=Pinctada imbricata TaxID=66713 RepID=A0AA89BYI0_PINIB|nr:hypothetical protein FSP39_005172 [Pinctada imbricata]
MEQCITKHLPSPRGDGIMNDLHDAEMDNFHCLKSTQWPTSALPCIQRLVDRGWPSNNVLSNIVRTGCHLVPMGDRSSDKQQLEWRISFSEAETALVCEMNHCQFLCFGFLKIFLQRVINTREEIGGLLCSYIMKTTILWEIIYNRGRWAKQDFLKLFWNCFRRLMSWVRNGYCPDFFIPENNLFFGKIYGRTQRVLLQQLIPLYNEGYRCLPVCNCVGCMSVLLQPNTCSLHTTDIDFYKVTVDLMVIKDEVDTLLSIDDISILFKQITLLEQIQRQNVSYNTSLIAGYFLHLQTQYFLFCSALQIFGNSYSSHNKDNYKSVCKFAKALKRNRFDLLTHDILSAMLFYKLGMHRHALRIALDMRERIQRTYLMYYWTLDLEAYRAAGGEINPVDIMMRRHFLKTLSLHESMCLPELLLEHQSLEDSIEYHPIVFVYFLLFLCHHRLSMHNGADSVLNDLVTLVNNDYRYHIPDKLRGISLEILGICQEMGGYTDEARASYNQVLQEPQCRKFREVTRYRFQNLN